MPYCTPKTLLREQISCSVLSVHTHTHTHTHTQTKPKRYKETCGCDGYVHCLDSGDGFMVCVYVQAHQTAYTKYVQVFVYQPYLKKAVFKKTVLIIYDHVLDIEINENLRGKNS